MTLSRSIFFLLVSFLLLPFIVLMAKGFSAQPLSFLELFFVVKWSFIQSFISSLGSLLVGSIIAFGLCSVTSGYKKRIIESFCLLPNFVPTLNVVLAVMPLVSLVGLGISLVVGAHVLINAGLIGIALYYVVSNKLGSYIEMAWVEGIPRLALFKACFSLVKKDLIYIFLFVFMMCFSSFTVPVFLGGELGMTLDVLIFNKIKTSGDWGVAISLAFVQSFILFLGLLILRGSSAVVSKTRNLEYISFRPGLMVPFVLTFVCLLPLFQDLVVGFERFFLNEYFVQEVQQNLLNSFLLCLFTGTVVYLFTLLICFCFSNPLSENFFVIYSAPGAVITGFALLILLEPMTRLSVLLVIAVGLLLLYVLPLYRLFIMPILDGLRKQVLIAKSLGASPWVIFWYIVRPQISQKAGIAAGVAAFWAVGDYGISTILAPRDMTLGLSLSSLLSSYRMEIASALSFLVLCVGLLFFFFFMGVGYVGRK